MWEKRAARPVSVSAGAMLALCIPSRYMVSELVLGIFHGGAAELRIDAQVVSRKRRQS
jgi:hypothetical protein